MLRLTLYVFIASYIVGWAFVVPEAHRQFVARTTDKPHKTISRAQPHVAAYYLPMLRVKSEVERLDYSPQKNPHRYSEEQLSVVIPVAPFVAYFRYSFWSSGFGFGGSGWVVWFFSSRDYIYTSRWIT